jgi:hydroxymethylpyrimidine pyrophosphatase-like HAD family hydrolase
LTFHSSARHDLVICDVDGCLSSESAEPFDVEGLSAIAAHNRLAIHQRDRPIVTVCTGRPIPFAEAMCRLIQNSVVPCVGENGVWLWDPASNAHRSDPAITAEHWKILQAARSFVQETFGPRGVVLQPGKSASVTLYHSDTAILHEIFPELKAEFEKRGWPFRVSMTWLYINCDLSFISKASGIRRLLEATGIPPERTAGIGDTMSDRPIAEAVADFACPANASEEIQKFAKYVSPEPEVLGVVDILNWLAKR